MFPSEQILLVSDIPDHLAEYDRALRTSGFQVRAVSAGAEALAAARASPPDLAVVDVRLPDMSGWELCRAMKDEVETGNPPVLMLSQEVTRSCAADSAKSGCNAWLAHPGRAGDLVNAVRHVLALDADVPASPEQALLGITHCPACGADGIRATLRMSLIQYYACAQCRLRWRVDAVDA